MTESKLSETNRVLKEALALAPVDPGRALTLLQQALAKSRLSGDREGIRSLARSAGIICINLGDLRVAIAFFEEALAAAPQDPYLHFACGEVYRRLGALDDAAKAFTRSEDLARELGDQEMVRMASKARFAQNDGPAVE